jgi:hypothetical protein
MLFCQKIVVIDSHVYLLFCMLPLLQLYKEELIHGLSTLFSERSFTHNIVYT